MKLECWTEPPAEGSAHPHPASSRLNRMDGGYESPGCWIAIGVEPTTLDYMSAQAYELCLNITIVCISPHFRMTIIGLRLFVGTNFSGFRR